MIQELTKAQEELLEKRRQEWFDIGTSSDNNFELAQEVITKLYEKMNLEKPIFLFVDSPYQGNVAIDMVKRDAEGPDEITPENFQVHLQNRLADIKAGNYDEKNIDFSYTYLWGSLDSYWISFYKFCEEIGAEYEKEDSELLDLWAQLATACGWWYPYENVCFVSKKATAINLNEENQLHNEDGPAISHEDGFNIYALNGVAVPRWLIETPNDEIDPNKILTIDNAEQRMIAMRYVGLENFLSSLPHKVIDTDSGYELLDVTIDGREGCIYLKMDNPSVPGKVHLEGVAPEIKTVSEALDWRFQIVKKQKPSFEA